MIPLMQAGPSRREGKRGGGGGNGLRVLQAGLSRYRRIRSTTRGSVMKETIFISAPHLQGASAIQCCYAATERRESSTLTDTGESKNANVTLRIANKSIVDEKISLNVSRLATNPACMAGVLSSRPNFSAL